MRRGVKTAFLRDEGRRPDTSNKFTILQIDGRSRSKCSLSNVAGKGSRHYDFCTTERAIFNSSGFEVGEKLLSSQLVVEISSEEKKSGISEGVGILLIRVILSSKKVTNVLARSSADGLVGKLFSAFLSGGDGRLNEIGLCCRCQPPK